MNNLMIFENKPVEVFELNGQVLFNPYHVGECLEISPEGVRKAITRMSDRQVIKLKTLMLLIVTLENYTIQEKIS